MQQQEISNTWEQLYEKVIETTPKKRLSGKRKNAWWNQACYKNRKELGKEQLIKSGIGSFDTYKQKKSEHKKECKQTSLITTLG